MVPLVCISYSDMFFGNLHVYIGNNNLTQVKKDKVMATEMLEL